MTIIRLQIYSAPALSIMFLLLLASACPLTAQNTPLRQPPPQIISMCIAPFPATINEVLGGFTKPKDSIPSRYAHLDMAESAYQIFHSKLMTSAPAKSQPLPESTTPKAVDSQKKVVTIEDLMSNPENRQKISAMTGEERMAYFKKLNVGFAEKTATPAATSSNQAPTAEEKSAIAHLAEVNACLKSAIDCSTAKELPVMVRELDTTLAAITRKNNDLEKEYVDNLRKAFKESKDNSPVFEKKAMEILHDAANKSMKIYEPQLAGISQKVQASKDKLLAVVAVAQPDITLLNNGAASSAAAAEIAALQGYTLEWCGKILEIESKLLKKCAEMITLESRAQANKQLLYHYVK